MSLELETIKKASIVKEEDEIPFLELRDPSSESSDDDSDIVYVSGPLPAQDEDAPSSSQSSVDKIDYEVFDMYFNNYKIEAGNMSSGCDSYEYKQVLFNVEPSYTGSRHSVHLVFLKPFIQCSLTYLSSDDFILP